MNRLYFWRMLLVFAVFALMTPANGLAAGPEGTLVAGGLNGPMGLLAAPDGNLWIIDSGTGGTQEVKVMDPESGQETVGKIGDSARIIKVSPDGIQTEEAKLPSVMMGTETTGGARLALLDGKLYATNGTWNASVPGERMPKMAAIVRVDAGQLTEVANTWDLEKSQNPDGTLQDTHPYGLLAGPDGKLWVADAGGNDLLKVDPASGQVSVAAAFGGLPGPMANPNRGNRKESDPVPTGIALGKDGAVYVSFLTGVPFLPGSAKVVRVDAAGKVSDYATGLTTLTDLKAVPDGTLYAVSFGIFGEKGPQPNTGAVYRIQEGSASEEVLSGLSFPTAIAFNAAGDAYVTINGAGAPGSGEVRLYKGLTSMPGKALAPAVLPQTGADGQPDLTVLLMAAGLVLLGGSVLLGRRRLVVRND